MSGQQRLQQNGTSIMGSEQKCTGLSNCRCQMCHKQIQIIRKLTLRQGLEWFGRRKSLSLKNHSTKNIQIELMKIDKKQERKNRKNHSETFDRVKNHLDCNSSYLANYNKKQLQTNTICHPPHQLGLVKEHGNTFKTIYYDSFRSKNIKLDKEKVSISQIQPIKKLQVPLDLPFLGKSSYRAEFAKISLTDRSQIAKPKDCIKTINLDMNKNQSDSSKNISNNTKGLEIFRPPSPFKDKGHMIKSNSYTFAYNTFYQNTFQRQKGQEVLISEPNPQFLRRSKFGSLSKTRWMTRQKMDDLKSEQILQMYK